MSHEDDNTSNAGESIPGPSPTTAGGRPFRAEWDRSDRPSMAVVQAVAAATDCEPTALPPLHQYVDPDALDALLTGGPGRMGTPDGSGAGVRVSFEYDDVAVDVSSAGSIEVWPDDVAHGRVRAGPQTAAELETRLRELFRAARRNGVSVRGGWVLRNGPEVPDWDLHVTRVAKPEDEGEDAPDPA